MTTLFGPSSGLVAVSKRALIPPGPPSPPPHTHTKKKAAHATTARKDPAPLAPWPLRPPGPQGPLDPNALRTPRPKAQGPKVPEAIMPPRPPDPGVCAVGSWVGGWVGGGRGGVGGWAGGAPGVSLTIRRAILESLWDPCGILVGSLWDPCGILVGSLWDPCEILVGAPRGAVRKIRTEILFSIAL